MILYSELAALFKFQNRNQKDLESIWPEGPTLSPVIRELFHQKAVDRQPERSASNGKKITFGFFVFCFFCIEKESKTRLLKLFYLFRDHIKGRNKDQ